MQKFTQEQVDYICERIGDWYFMWKSKIVSEEHPRPQHRLGIAKEELKEMILPSHLIKNAQDFSDTDLDDEDVAIMGVLSRFILDDAILRSHCGEMAERVLREPPSKLKDIQLTPQEIVSIMGVCMVAMINLRIKDDAPMTPEPFDNLFDKLKLLLEIARRRERGILQ